MPKDIEKLLKDYRKKVESVSDSHVKRIILYGSYARDDFKFDSDIDVMVLVDLDDLFMKAYEDKIIDLTYEFNYEYGTDIMPVIQNIEHFEYWKNAYMFYKNVETEGVEI